MKKLALLSAAAIALLAMGCNDYLCLAPPGTTANSKLTICHATGKKGKYELLTIKASAAEPHIDHGDFLAPAGAKKASECVIPPVVVPPVVVPPVVVPPVVVPPVVVPPVVIPPVVVPPVVVPPVVVPPVVVPPVVVPPVVVPPVVIPPPPEDDGAVKDITPEEAENMPCLFDDSRPECQL